MLFFCKMMLQWLLPQGQRCQPRAHFCSYFCSYLCWRFAAIYYIIRNCLGLQRKGSNTALSATAIGYRPMVKMARAPLVTGLRLQWVEAPPEEGVTGQTSSSPGLGPLICRASAAMEELRWRWQPTTLRWSPSQTGVSCKTGSTWHLRWSTLGWEKQCCGQAGWRDPANWLPLHAVLQHCAAPGTDLLSINDMSTCAKEFLLVADLVILRFSESVLFCL